MSNLMLVSAAEFWKWIGNSGIGNLATVLAVLLVVIELNFAWREARKERIRNRKLETLNILATYLERFSGFSVWLKKQNLDDPDALDAEVEKKIREYLRVVERIAVGVKHETYSLEVLADLQSKALRHNFVSLKPFIDHIRTTNETDRIWDVYEWLCFEIEKVSPETILPFSWQCVTQRKLSQEK